MPEGAREAIQNLYDRRDTEGLIAIVKIVQISEALSSDIYDQSGSGKLFRPSKLTSAISILSNFVSKASTTPVAREIIDKIKLSKESIDKMIKIRERLVAIRWQLRLVRNCAITALTNLGQRIAIETFGRDDLNPGITDRISFYTSKGTSKDTRNIFVADRTVKWLSDEKDRMFGILQSKGFKFESQLGFVWTIPVIIYVVSAVGTLGIAVYAVMDNSRTNEAIRKAAEESAVEQAKIADAIDSMRLFLKDWESIKETATAVPSGLLIVGGLAAAYFLFFRKKEQ